MSLEEKSERWQEVGVNKAALLNKSLCNYSGPFDVFRELIQNADDANADKIEIHFDVAQGDNVDKWTIRDNGRGLVGHQWDRLCTIADGNDDSDKIGTFGVGFYTVLGVCDNPCVRSNNEYLQMKMFQDGKLRTKRDSCKSDGWTSVELVLKDGLKERLPNLLGLARFLISSITFLERVTTITVFLADQKLCIQKNLKSSSPVEVQATSSPGIMAIKSINSAAQSVSIHAIGKSFLAGPKTRLDKKTVHMKGFALSSQTLNQTTSQPSETTMKWPFEISYCLYIAQAEADPPREMEKGVNSILKGLPRGFSYKAVYFNTVQRKVVEGSSLQDLFEGSDGILPQKNSGRIFIGQSTKEPTSIGLHIACKHIIPDVVRSSVQLGNNQAGKWNESLLNTAGHLARAIYEHEMKTASKLEPAKLKEWGLYTMQQFAFDQDLGSGTPSYHLKSGFFSIPNQSVLSNCGISDVSLIRRYDEALHSVLKSMPHLDTALSAEQRKLIEDQWKILFPGSDDIVKEFTFRHLSEVDMEKFFGWWGDGMKKGFIEIDGEEEKAFFKDLCDNGRLYCKECGDIELKGIEQYTQLVHHKDLLPPATIYIHQPQLFAHYLDLFGWKPLDPIIWLRSICRSDRVDPGKAFDSRILPALGGPHGIPTTSLQDWKQAKNHLASFECISTSRGFRRPGDSYVRIAGIWNDVPVVNDHSTSDGVYELIGVRTRFEWGELLDRLEASIDYTNDRFLPYLADMLAKEGLSDWQTEDLRKRKVFDSETHGKFAAVALHQPDELGDRLREFNLPILSLRGTGSFSTDFLNKLGFKVYPLLEELNKWLATLDNTRTNLARQYLKKYGAKYREEAKKSDLPLIPTRTGILGHPNEVVSCPSWEELGFHVISTPLAEYAAVLGVEKNPRPDKLIEYLEKKAPSMEVARRWNKQLSRCVNEFKREHFKKLEEVRFIPFETYPIQPELPSTTHQRLKDCFVKSSLPGHKPYLTHFLPFMECGDNGDDFPVSCAPKQEPPRISDIAKVMMARPPHFLQTATVDCYENELRDIAKEFDSFPKELQEAMRESPFLVGMRNGSYEEKPMQASRILIGGDKENLSDFCQSVVVAPGSLRALYEKLGSKLLDTCVTYNVYPTDAGTTDSPPLDPEDIIRCAKTLKEEELEEDWQDDMFDQLRVQTCQKLELKKTLDCSLGVFSVSGPVTAGLRQDPHGLVTLWIVRDADPKIMYTDIATALCRKLFKAYSRRDVLAMKLLLMDKESRVDYHYKMRPTVPIIAPCGTSQDGADFLGSEPHEDKQHSSNNRHAPSPTWFTFLRHMGKFSPEKRKRKKIVVVLKHDLREVTEQAIGSTTRKPDSSKDSRKFRELTGTKRKDVYCGQIDTDLEADGCFEKYGIIFFRAKKSHYPKRLEEVVETFAKLVIDLAVVFKMSHATFRIFWKDSDPNLMAFNHKKEHIYLNVAHYFEHHYKKKVDEKTVILDWYLIFAHEIAHNVSFYHDELHERAFAGLCVSRLDALRKCFRYNPPLGWMP